MTAVAWGDPVEGVRFGLRAPQEAEAGGSIVLELVCENRSTEPIALFGFRAGYPRALRLSPPRPQRPYLRIAFADTAVLHPPDAFLRLAPGGQASTGLDVSWAFDRRGAGRWPVVFVYEPVRAAGGLRPWSPSGEGEARTGLAELVVTRARSLREAGIDEALEADLDAAMLRGDPDVVERLRAAGPGGLLLAARRVGRIVASGSESILGWRALDALGLLGPPALEAIARCREELPHAATAYDYAADWLASRQGHPTPTQHMPFVTMLERLVDDPSARGNFLLGWTPLEGPQHGTRRLQLLGTGEWLLSSRPPGAPVISTRRGRVSERQMQALLLAMRYAAVWLLRPLREQGLPDEPRPALEVQLALGDPYCRRVALWNGEWRHGPAATLADLLDRLCDEPGSIVPPPPVRP
ncbi:MAG: hypothetical protein NZ898_08600 [Myxococcota bacterium]|nr:hypothetical protein [Myxococcota bacterium]MDW8363093.1 hypothetical protein [Myxococcales bacterium]